MPAETIQAQQFAAIVRSVAEAIIAVNAQGRITLINTVAERLFHVHEAQALGQPLAALNAALGRWLAEARANAKATPGPLVFELEVSGDHFYAATLAPVQAEDGQPAGWMVILQEVTHLKKAEQWRAEAVQTAAHDLRNPVNLMNGALNLLRDALPEVTAEQNEYLTMTRASLERMEALIDQVLSFDQMNGPDGLRISGVALNEVLKKAVAEFRVMAQEKGLQLEFTGPASDARVMGDTDWLHRAAANLLSNAIKYTPAGGHVQVRYREADGQAIGEVMDDGPGIPASAQARLFERFYRVRNEITRRAPGTGLGLAIVKAIVEQHNGRVWVSSVEGKGSTFGFALPLMTV